MIGRLDRLLSEFLLAAEGPLDGPDYQTVKHHADDLIGVGNAALKRLQAAGRKDIEAYREPASLKPTFPRMADPPAPHTTFTLGWARCCCSPDTMIKAAVALERHDLDRG